MIVNANDTFMEPPDTLQKLVNSLMRHGDRTAVFTFPSSGVETRSFTELVSAAHRLAAGLAKSGIPPGAPVLLFASNSCEWLIACFALLTIAAVPVVVDTQLSDDDLRHVLRDSEPTRGFATSTLARRLAGSSEDARMTLIVLDSDEDDPRHWKNYQAEDHIDALEPVSVAQPTDPAVLFYTSGTTGAPKGVPLSHHNLMTNLQAFLRLRLIRDTDRFLLPVPLHHVYAFTVGMLGPLTAGASLVFPRSLTGPQIVRALHDAQATVIIGVPRFYAALYAAIEARVRSRGRWAAALFSRALALSIMLRRRFGISIGSPLFAPLHKQFAPCLRAVVSGGAAIDTDLAWKLEGLGWQTASGYGLTETSPILTFNPPGVGRIGAVGRPLPGVHIRIAAPEPSDGQGEVQAKGPNVFAGYWRLPEQTRAAFTVDGYFRTGDLGYFDEDGYLHLVGRASSIVQPGVWCGCADAR